MIIGILESSPCHWHGSIAKVQNYLKSKMGFHHFAFFPSFLLSFFLSVGSCVYLWLLMHVCISVLCMCMYACATLSESIHLCVCTHVSIYSWSCTSQSTFIENLLCSCLIISIVATPYPVASQTTQNHFKCTFNNFQYYNCLL